MNIKSLITLCLLFFFINNSYSQTWYFGSKAGIKFLKSGNIYSVTSTTTPSSLVTTEGCAVAQDALGNIALYSDGSTVWNSAGNPITNGIGLNGGASATQSAIFIPVPKGNCNKYFIFTIPPIYNQVKQDAGFCYSIVEKNSTTQNWEIKPALKNISLINPKSTTSNPVRNCVTEKLTSFADGKGGYWVLVHGMTDKSNYPTTAQTDDGKMFYSFYIDPNNTGTINNSTTPVINEGYRTDSKIEYILDYTQGDGQYLNASQGQMKFNSSGTIIGFTTSRIKQLALFKFNPINGIVTNFNNAINPVSFDFSSIGLKCKGGALYGLEFSPNSKYLYVSEMEYTDISSDTANHIWQIDITQPNSSAIIASRKVLHFNYAASGNSYYSYGAMQLGPDGNIYVANFFDGTSTTPDNAISYIENPNFGSAIFKYRAITLTSGTSSRLGLPTVIQNESKCGVVVIDDGSTICGCPNVTNLITNGDFENGATGFTSKFELAKPNSQYFVPGMYTITNQAGATSLCQNWYNGSCARAGSTNGNFLIVNGQTGQTGVRTVWNQEIKFETGKDYKLCMTLRNLPQCCFNVNPKVTITYFDGIKRQTLGPIDVTVSSCPGQKVTFNISIPQNASPTINSNISIDLDQSGLGDGNDLAIDDISLIKLNPFSSTATTFFIYPNTPTFYNSTDYSVSVSLNSTPSLPAGSGIWWRVAELDQNNNEIPNTIVENPNSNWWNIPCNFPGYNGTSTVNGTSPGIFKTHKTYRIHFGTWGDCFSWTSASYTLRIDPASRKAILTPDNKPISRPKNIQ